MKKWARLIAAMLAFTLIAAACGDSNDSGSDTTDPPAATPTTDAAAPTTEATTPTTEMMEMHQLADADLTVWGWASSEAEDTQLNVVIDGINERTGANVSFEPQPEYDTALQASLVAGDPPDVFYVDSSKFPALVDSGALAPAPDGSISDVDDIYESLRDIFSVDGQLYCPPKDFSTLTLVINTEALDAAGASIPTTWDELAATAEALTTGDAVGLTFGTEYARAAVFLFQAGASVLSADGTSVTLDTPEALAAMEFVGGLFADGYAAGPGDLDSGWAGEAFGNGAASMVITGNWIVGFLADNFPDREYVVVELPAGPAGPGTFAFTVCYGVSSAASDTALSFALADELTNTVGAKEWTDAFKVMPARASLAAGWLETNPTLEAFVAGAAYARPFQFPPGLGDLNGVFTENFQKMIAGDISAADLIAAVVSAANDLGVS